MSSRSATRPTTLTVGSIAAVYAGHPSAVTFLFFSRPRTGAPLPVPSSIFHYVKPHSRNRYYLNVVSQGQGRQLLQVPSKPGKVNRNVIGPYYWGSLILGSSFHLIGGPAIFHPSQSSGVCSLTPTKTYSFLPPVRPFLHLSAKRRRR